MNSKKHPGPSIRAGRLPILVFLLVFVPEYSLVIKWCQPLGADHRCLASVILGGTPLAPSFEAQPCTETTSVQVQDQLDGEAKAPLALPADTGLEPVALRRKADLEVMGRPQPLPERGG